MPSYELLGPEANAPTCIKCFLVLFISINSFYFLGDFRDPYKSEALGCSLCIKTALKVAPTSNVRGKSERYLNIRVHLCLNIRNSLAIEISV